MMKWVIGIVIMAIGAAVIEMSNTNTSVSDIVSHINTIATQSHVTVNSSIFSTLYGFAKISLEFMKSVLAIALTWNIGFLNEGVGQYVKVILLAIGIIAVFFYIIQTIKGAMTG